MKMVAIQYCLYLFTSICLGANLNAQAQNTSSFLPIPTGKYSIGTKEIFLTDTLRLEKYSRNNDFRNIAIKIWYPSDSVANSQKDLYMASIPTDDLYNTFKPKGIKKPFVDFVKTQSTNSTTNIAISKQQKTYPTLIFSPGYYFGLSDLYSSIIENLASQGYIVCSITHPYEQPYCKFPNDKEIRLKKFKTRKSYLQLLYVNYFVIPKMETFEEKEKVTYKVLKKLKLFDKALDLWVEDSEFFIDFIFQHQQNENSFFHAIDTSKIAAFGHSFGGAVAGQLSIVDPRVKAGINMDCFQFGDAINKSIHKPFMLIESNSFQTWRTGNEVVYSHSKSPFYKLFIKKSNHFIFSDASVLPFNTKQESLEFINTENGAELIKIINAYILHFFDLYLKNKSEEMLQYKVDNSEIKFEFNYK